MSLPTTDCPRDFTDFFFLCGNFVTNFCSVESKSSEKNSCKGNGKLVCLVIDLVLFIKSYCGVFLDAKYLKNVS